MNIFRILCTYWLFWYNIISHSNQKNKHTNTEAKEAPTLELEVYGIKCDEISCNKTFDPKDVFICKHNECANDGRIYCYKCTLFKHRNKGHKFDPSERYIKSVRDLYEFDQTTFHVKYSVHSLNQNNINPIKLIISSLILNKLFFLRYNNYKY